MRIDNVEVFSVTVARTPGRAIVAWCAGCFDAVLPLVMRYGIGDFLFDLTYSELPTHLLFPTLGYPFYMFAMTFAAGGLFILPLLAVFVLLGMKSFRFIRDGGNSRQTVEIVFLSYVIGSASWVVGAAGRWLFSDSDGIGWIMPVVVGVILAVLAYARRG